LPSDEKKHDLNQVFQSWDREHREPTSPVSEAEAPIISDKLREVMKKEARFARVARNFMNALQNKPLQDAIKAEQAAIEAELDAESREARDGREKAPAAIPQRSLEPAPEPRTDDIKPPTPGAEIAKPTTTENHAINPKQLSKVVDEGATVEEKNRLWIKAEKGIDLLHAEARMLYEVGKTELHDRLNKGELQRGKRGFVTAASIRAHPPGFIDRKTG
jgi:hypothetical protein